MSLTQDKKWCKCGHWQEDHSKDLKFCQLINCDCRKFDEFLSPLEKEEKKGDEIFERDYQERLE